MRHTIVIELPDDALGGEVEVIVTRRLEMTNVPLGEDQDGNLDYGRVSVVEYHHEQMTTTEDPSPS